MYRFESIASDHRIPEVRLIEEAHGFLEGAALEFYWSCSERNRFITWAEMRSLFRERFQDFRTDLVIKSALESRRQKPGESFLDFYNDILNLSAPLQNPISTSELIFLLTKNMRTTLQFELASWVPSSLGELVQRCVNTENTWKRLGMAPEYYTLRKNVHEVSTSHIPIYEPTPSHAPQYGRDIPEFFPQVRSSNYSANNHVDALNSLTDRKLICWNCGGNHRFFDCEFPVKGIFCFGCGRKNVLKPRCPICTQQTQGNRTEGVRGGLTHSQRQETTPQRTSTTEAAANTDPELYRRNLQILKRQN